MTTQPETLLVRRIRRALEKHYPNIFIFKVHGGPSQERGIPDLLVCHRGCFIALEVKHPDEDHPVSRIQAAQMSRIQRAGGVAVAVESIEEAMAAVERALYGKHT